MDWYERWMWYFLVAVCGRNIWRPLRRVTEQAASDAATKEDTVEEDNLRTCRLSTEVAIFEEVKILKTLQPGPLWRRRKNHLTFFPDWVRLKWGRTGDTWFYCHVFAHIYRLVIMFLLVAAYCIRAFIALCGECGSSRIIAININTKDKKPNGRNYNLNYNTNK